MYILDGRASFTRCLEDGEGMGVRDVGLALRCVVGCGGLRWDTG